MHSACFKILIFIFALFASSANASNTCPDFDSREWSSHCFVKTPEGSKVAPSHLKNLVFNDVGIARVVISHPRELVAVDRKGVIVIPDIAHTGDFDYPDARHGLGRFRSVHVNDSGKAVSKCGYFDGASFKIVIPADYDHCEAFGEETAIVCVGCEVYCIELECRNSTFAGGQGFEISPNNVVLRKFLFSPIDSICGALKTARVTKISAASSYLECVPSAE